MNFFERACGTDELYELYDGIPTALASPNIFHRDISREVSVELVNFGETMHIGFCDFDQPVPVGIWDNKLEINIAGLPGE